MPDRSLDRAIDGLARRQHGAFSRRQAVRIGFTAKMIRSRWHAGHWVKLRCSDDIFVLPSHPGTWERQCTAATLSVPGSAVSGAAAAALHGFPGWPRAGIEVVTRRGGTNRSLFATVRQSDTVGRLTTVDGIRVVSPADCLVQLAGQLDEGALGELTDLAGQGRPHLLDELRDRHVALSASRLAGSAVLGAVLARRGDDHVPPASQLECHLRRLLESIPALPVEWEATPPWCVPGTQRVDALVPSWRLVVEADGRAWHTRVEDFERDRERDAVALAHGHETLRLTWNQLVHRPRWCRTVLLAIGARRSGPG